MKHILPLLGCSLLAALAISAQGGSQHPAAGPSQHCLRGDGVAVIPRGTVALGEDGAGRPGIATIVGRFDIDRHEVTNRQFSAFVSATRYRTFAERDGAGAVFVSPVVPLASDNPAQWWRMVKGADWLHPMGPGSKALPDFPVVQITYEDAMAYARWRGRRLPDAREWERAARGGRSGNQQQLSWAFDKAGRPTANTWQGIFPLVDTGEDGFRGIAPVGCFAPNGFGLYDMIGNVWEWTSNVSEGNSRVVRGGSFLCSANYCANFRPAGRQAQEENLPTSHIGFRTVRSF